MTSDATPDEDLRAMFVDEACHAFYDAFDDQRREWEHVDPGGTWLALSDTERNVALGAMDRLLDWLDARRLP